ncbi:hypothetical protein [Desulfofalx alkaliphila]|uniref:hypothetical protein n=1 Tax=Desulfofalx alkaliphila TaxID=105483 RepID=UPI0004E0D69B|nr:hypothetical protein [Desulfofalx alkaliphila]
MWAYVIGGAFLCWLLWVVAVHFYFVRTAGPVEVLVQDQADWVEGFVRTAAAANPGVELVLVDTGSRDETAQVLARLAYRCGFQVKNEPSYQGVIFDARGLTGSKLIKAPLFSQISTTR